MTTSSRILQSYLKDALNRKLTFCHKALLTHNREMNGGDFLTPLNFYLSNLVTIDPIIIPYLQEEKAQLKYDLEITHLLLLAEKHYELSHQKTENSKKYDLHIRRCEILLDMFNPTYQELIAKSPEQAYFSDGKPVKYCGIPLAKEFAEKIATCMERKTKTIKETLSTFNDKRLYWVWGSLFIKTMLNLIPEDFYNAQQAANTIKTPDPYFGALSWSLYYFRFSLNLFLLLKHTIKGPWMSEEEGNTPWHERFQTQWAQRKFMLLNDSLWGIANFVCFFWLNGKGILGTWGDALTLMLLVFDISMALWDLSEQQTQYKAQIKQYDEDIKQLMAAAAEEETEERKLKTYQIQLNALKRARQQCQRDWELQKLDLFNNSAYAITLMLAFTLLTMPFMPISAATALTLSTVGALLCFALTVISRTIKDGSAIYQLHQSKNETEDKFQEHLKNLNVSFDLNNNENKLRYLEIKKFHAETEYQKQLIVLQSVHLVRSIMINALVPAIVFSCLVFFPLTIGFGALGAVLGLAIASNHLINKLLTPDEKKKELSPFISEEYDAFCEFVQNQNSDSPKICSKKYHAFFTQQKTEDTKTSKFADAAKCEPISSIICPKIATYIK
ncbi:hypothetical protein [Legionella sp.]|uniref:hypothetical protein n=1 Tax=Legionella sp. TaxID=459 RepID=UPI003C96DE59